MNIKSRLKKMEDQIIKEDSEFCCCVRPLEIHVIEPDINKEKGYCETCNGVCLFDKDIPCDVCGKLFLTELIIPTPPNEIIGE